MFFTDVVKVIDKLEPHKDFSHKLVDGGGIIDLIVDLPGDINIGDMFRWRDMARLGALPRFLDANRYPLRLKTL